MENKIEYTDEQLVALVRSKDKELYRTLMQRYEKKLMNYIRYFVRDELRAADVVQESFIKAYINLQGFNTKKKFSSWIYRIAHNEAMNIINKYRKEVTLDDHFEYTSPGDIEKEVGIKELQRKAHDCLGAMPMLYAEPLALYFLEEKTYDEISDILRIPMGTVATRINRAKVIMKKICQKNR